MAESSKETKTAE